MRQSKERSDQKIKKRKDKIFREWNKRNDDKHLFAHRSHWLEGGAPCSLSSYRHLKKISEMRQSRKRLIDLSIADMLASKMAKNKQGNQFKREY